MYPFFANRNYYYLTGLEEPNAVLAAVRQHDTVEWILFVEKVDATYARWYGERLAEEEILVRSMLTVSDSSKQFWPWFLNHIEPWQTTIYLDLHRYSDTDPDSCAETLEKHLYAMFNHVQVQSSHPLMERLRMVKEDAEIACMQQGIGVARECFLRMMAVSSPGITEYRLKAEAEYVAAYANVRNMAFQPIITTGNDLSAPEVCPLGHARQPVRHAPFCQRGNLRRQDFFQHHTARGVFVIAPGKTFWPMAGKCADFHGLFTPTYSFHGISINSSLIFMIIPSILMSARPYFMQKTSILRFA